MKKIIILLICFYGVCAHAQPFMLDQVVGFVGSKTIKQSDVEFRYLDARRMGYPVHGDMKCEIFEQLLTEKLLMNQAEVDSLIVEPSEVELDLERRLGHMVSPEDQGKLEEYYKKSIYEIKDDFRKLLHDQKLAEKMQREITSDVKITPSEVRSFYNRLPKDSIPLINGQAEIAQIVMYPPYSDEAISEVREKLLEMRRRIVAGETTFRTLAVLHSECPSSQNGGELGFSNRGELDPEFAKTAWALKNPGDISRIVESKNGYHIIQLIAKRGDQVNVRHILITPKPNPEAIATVTGRLDSLARRIRTDELNWNTAALYYSEDENTRFNGGLMINRNERSPLFGSTLFETDELEKADYETVMVKKMKIGEISDPYESRDEKGRVVYKIARLKNLSDAHRANLKLDYSFLSDLALQEKTFKVIREWVNEKIETSYIYIEESFKRCGLSNNNWLKQ